MENMNGARPMAVGRAQADEERRHHQETTPGRQDTSSVLEAALRYRSRGYAVVDLPHRSKKLTRPGWQHERWTEEQIRERFGNGPRNVAVLLGAPSGGLVDLDIDCREALALADQYLPLTLSEFGRVSKRRSHRLYTVEGGISTEKFQDPLRPRDEAMLVEIRSTGCYTVMPGSVHESGERVTWHQDGEPARIAPSELRVAVARLASAALLARYYPAQGSRHDFTLALAGGLLSANWEPDESREFILSIAQLAGDEEADQRLANVETTARRHAEGGAATGWTRLAEIIEVPIVRSVKKWLGVPPERRAQGGGARDSAASVLVGLAADSGTEFFHTPDGKPYVTVEIAGHRETWALGSKHSRRYMARLFHKETGKAAGSQAIQDALNVLTGRAMFDGPEIPVYARLGMHEGRFYLDLASDQWEAVEIGPDGWRVLADPPVKFRRARGVLGLTHPVSGGSLDELRRFVNIEGESDWVLLVAWLLASARPHGPYPVLILSGEQGSAKSTTARVLRSLVDPNVASIRAEPREPRDLMIAAANGLVIALDNLSRVPDWLSDALCRLATGGGFATRELYSDDEETIFEAQRPVILNGIEDLATRGDLAERAIVLRLPRITEEGRRTEKEFWSEFEAARPRIVGALLDVLSAAMARLPDTRLDRLPRMADFAQLIVAAEPALGWESGTFMSAYDAAQSDASGLAREADSVALAVIGFMEKGPPRTELVTTGIEMRAREWEEQGLELAWEGNASLLLERLNSVAGEATQRARSWPKTPAHLSGRLRRIAPSLRGAGIEVELRRTKHGSAITLRLERECDGSSPSSSSSPASPGREGEPPDDEAAPSSPGGPGASPEDGSVTQPPPDGGAGDDGDAPMHSRSNGRVRVPVGRPAAAAMATARAAAAAHVAVEPPTPSPARSTTDQRRPVSLEELADGQAVTVPDREGPFCPVPAADQHSEV